MKWREEKKIYKNFSLSLNYFIFFFPNVFKYLIMSLAFWFEIIKWLIFEKKKEENEQQK